MDELILMMKLSTTVFAYRMLLLAMNEVVKSFVDSPMIRENLTDEQLSKCRDLIAGVESVTSAEDK